MSKNKRESKHLQLIIERTQKQFPDLPKAVIKQIWLNGFSEGRQNRPKFKRIERIGDCSVEKVYYGK